MLVAHRLGTVDRADQVVVLDHGRVVQQGPRAVLAAAEGPFRTLLTASCSDGTEHEQALGVEVPGVEVTGDEVTDAEVTGEVVPDGEADGTGSVGVRRRSGPPPELREPGPGLSLARGIAHALRVTPRWGIGGGLLFLAASLVAAQGAVTGFLWGRTVEGLRAGEAPVALVAVLVVLLLLVAPCGALAFRLYPRWWVEVLLRVRMAVLVGQTQQHRLRRTPPGEVVARALDADRFARYADRWVDLANGLVLVAVTAVLSWSLLAGAVLLGVLVVGAACALAGRRAAGRSATRSAAARATFGRALVSALDAARTVKLAARTPDVHAHLRRVDSGRVEAAVREHRVQAVLDGVPIVAVQAGVVVAWAALLGGVWDLASTLLVAGAVAGFNWFGVVAGAVVTEAPGTRAWQRATAEFAGGADLCAVPRASTCPRVRRRRRGPTGATASSTWSCAGCPRCDDGTVGVAKWT